MKDLPNAGNVDDRESLKQDKFLEDIKGKLGTNKGYTRLTLFENLFLNDIQLVTKVKNNEELSDEYCRQDPAQKKNID